MSFIKTQIVGKVFQITLNRPDKFNSFNRAMAMELLEALELAKNSQEIRCVYLTGEGKAFCAGQDLSEAIDPQGPGIQRIVEEHYNPIILALRNLPKPVVCAVNGVAAGAGANIALAADVVVAANAASFIQAFSKIGLIPDSGGTFFLPRLIGFGKASALMMLGDKVSAADAKQMGMIYQTAEDDKLAEVAGTIANTLAEMPTAAIWMTKQLLNESMTQSLEKQLSREGAMQVEATKTFDYTEGVNAFLQKRKPAFKGE